jgi:hypothetical protein
MNTHNIPSILPTGQTARLLRVPVAWLRAEAEAGRVPCLRAGKVLLFNLAAVERTLAARAAESPECRVPDTHALHPAEPKRLEILRDDTGAFDTAE